MLFISAIPFSLSPGNCINPFNLLILLFFLFLIIDIQKDEINPAGIHKKETQSLGMTWVS